MSLPTRKFLGRLVKSGFLAFPPFLSAAVLVVVTTFFPFGSFFG
jgi:hypothetical protein